MFPNALINVLAGVAASALQTVANNPANGLTTAEVPAVTQAVQNAAANDPRLQEISKAVEEAATPVVWYQDKITLTQIVGVIASIVGVVWGFQLTPEHQAIIVNIAPPVLTGIAAGAALVVRLVSRVKPVVSSKAKTV